MHLQRKQFHQCLTHNGCSSNFTYIKWFRFDMSFYNLNVLSESPLTMTSRHECRLFNWYHFASKRYDEWLLLFKDASGKQVVARFGNSCCASLFPKKELNKFKNGTRSILRSSFAGAPKKLRELRGQGHMQHGALMKLGLFGKQLCLSVFNYLQSMFRFVKNHSWLRILFHSFHWLFKWRHELYRGRYWCFADLLLSLLWQRCKAWVAEGSHLPSRCRQWKRVYRKTKQS